MFEFTILFIFALCLGCAIDEWYSAPAGDSANCFTPTYAKKGEKDVYKSTLQYTD